jgi:hypothetical protein
VPRRWAVHAAEWVPYAYAASLAATLVVLATLLFTVRIVSGLLRAQNVGTAH